MVVLFKDRYYILVKDTDGIHLLYSEYPVYNEKIHHVEDVYVDLGYEMIELVVADDYGALPVHRIESFKDIWSAIRTLENFIKLNLYNKFCILLNYYLR